MKALLFIQRILALGVIVVGFILSISELDVAASCGDQAALTMGGLALIVLGVGWLILTGVEEDWFVNKHTPRSIR